MSLITAGLAFLVGARASPLRVPLGVLFLGVGGLFSFSALSDVVKLPLDLDGFLLILLVLAVSQGFYELVLYLMGGAKKKTAPALTRAAGVAWSAALALVPLLDYAFDLGPAVPSVEDGLARPPLHATAVVLVYLWPAAATIAGLVQSRWNLSDIPLKSDRLMQAKLFAAAVVPILGLTAFALAGENRILYRAGNVLLELYMLAMYLLLIRYPDELKWLRKAVGEEHHRKLSIEEREALEIRQRLERLVDGERIHLTPGLSIDRLAKRMRVPPYRLSKYFSQHERRRFPVWLNEMRIGYVCAAMDAHPRRNILEIAFEAGYTSKTSFNKQFLAIKGISPSGYRERPKS